MKGTKVLSVGGLLLMLAGSFAAAEIPAGQCRANASHIAEKVLKALDANNVVAQTRVIRFPDRCFSGEDILTLTVVQRQLFTANNEWYRERLFPSGARQYLRGTQAIDDHVHMKTESGYLCPNGGSLVLRSLIQSLPLLPAGASPPNRGLIDDETESLQTWLPICQYADAGLYSHQ